MKRKFTLLGIALVLLAAQFITYYTLAEAKLPTLVAKNLIINTNYPSDTILLNTLVSVRGENNSIKPYSLNLSSKENLRLLRKKLAPSIIIDEADQSNELNSIKSKLSIVAVEENIFSVTVNTSYSYESQFYFNEDQYIWFLFSWLKI